MKKIKIVIQGYDIQNKQESFLLYMHNCLELAKYTNKTVDTPTYEYINGTEK